MKDTEPEKTGESGKGTVPEDVGAAENRSGKNPVASDCISAEENRRDGMGLAGPLGPKEGKLRRTPYREFVPLKQKFAEAVKLFLTFLRFGLFCFGGGYSMITMIEREMVIKKRWLTEEKLIDIMAVAESTPGAIAVNLATFIGTERAGFLGALFATLGLVTAPFLIIFTLSFFILEFKSIKWVDYAFRGVRAAVLVLVLGAVIKLMSGLERTVFAFATVAAVFALCCFTPIDTVWILIAAAAAGIIFSVTVRFYRRKRKGDKKA